MSGHTHAQNIRRKKAVIDAKRGKIFSKLSKAITVAARTGGGDPVTNLTLKYAIDKAKQGNMPRDTIARAIRKGTGEEGGADLVEQTFEGVGPGGVHMLVQCLTDNRNRTAPEMRNLFDKNGGKLGGPGSAAWMFELKGVIEIPQDQISEDALMEVALDAGAEDLATDAGVHEITAEIASFEAVKAAVEGAGLTPDTAELMHVPKSRVEVTKLKVARRLMRLLDALDDHEDVQNVASNEDFPDEIVAALEADG